VDSVRARRRGWLIGGVAAVLAGSAGLATFPLTAGLPLMAQGWLVPYVVGLAVLTAAGATVAVFRLKP
jgi:hypothetical protein